MRLRAASAPTRGVAHRGDPAIRGALREGVVGFVVARVLDFAPGERVALRRGHDVECTLLCSGMDTAGLGRERAVHCKDRPSSIHGAKGWQGYAHCAHRDEPAPNGNGRDDEGRMGRQAVGRLHLSGTLSSGALRRDPYDGQP